MQNPWLRFFALKLPAALLALAVACEAAAWALRSVQPFQNYLDYLVVAAERDPTQARWLVFGDSTVQEVLKDFRLGPPALVLNLTTHGGAGLPSAYLLLRRYLATHEPPQGIMLVLTPEMFLDIPGPALADTWLLPIFRRPEEQAWLSRFYFNAKPHGWRPAASDLKHRVLDPLTGLLAPRRDVLKAGAALPSPTIPVEAPHGIPEYTQKSAAERVATRLDLQDMPRAVLTDICGIAKNAGMQVHLLLAPVPGSVRQVWEARGDSARLDSALDTLMPQICGSLAHLVLQPPVQPPNFDGFSTHVQGFGWENRYALALRDYLLQQDGGISRRP